jgi:predicted component of type VI protein secretion system
MEYSEDHATPFLRELILEAEESRKLLKAAMHALKSYQYGNSAPDLAASIAGDIEKLLNGKA